MAKLYTKTGDHGETGLRGGERCNKNNPLVEAYGTVDELNSALGLALTEFSGQRSKVKGQLSKVQEDLFHVGALIAGEEKDKQKRLQYLDKRTAELEREIDRVQEKLPVQKGFYLPGGSQASARLDFARSLARRAERRIAALSDVEKEILKYINRLSDYLYALARRVNFRQKIEEKIWTGELRKA